MACAGTRSRRPGREGLRAAVPPGRGTCPGDVGLAPGGRPRVLVLPREWVSGAWPPEGRGGDGRRPWGADQEQLRSQRLSRAGAGGRVQGGTPAVATRSDLQRDPGSDLCAPHPQVHRVFPSGLAAQEGTIQKGDEVLSINGKSLKGATHSDALAILRQARDPRQAVVVTRRPAPTPEAAPAPRCSPDAANQAPTASAARDIPADAGESPSSLSRGRAWGCWAAWPGCRSAPDTHRSANTWPRASVPNNRLPWQQRRPRSPWRR